MRPWYVHINQFSPRWHEWNLAYDLAVDDGTINAVLLLSLFLALGSTDPES